jgi:dipeptidyl aminopeptidase/acylaminoacyl peptidase
MSLFRWLLASVAVAFLAGPAPSAGPILKEIDTSTTVYSVAFSPDGKTLAAQVGSLIYLWDAKTGKELRRIAEEPAPGVWSVAFSPDSKLVYAPLTDNTVASWEAATGKLVRMYKGHTSTVWSATVSRDGKVMASGGEDRTVRLWDTATGKELHQLAHDSGVWPFLFAHDGKTLVSVGSSGTLYVWDIQTGKQLNSFATDQSAWPLALSSDGHTAATVRWQGTTIHLWDLKTGKELRSLEMHSGTGWNLAFSPDGRLLAAGGANHALSLWEVATGRERLHLEGHRTPIDALDYSPDGRTVATAGKDGKVILWDVTGRLKDGKLTPARPTAKEVDALWNDLLGADGSKTAQAIWTLTAGGGASVPFLTDRVLQTAEKRAFDPAKVENLIADLDDNTFEVREKATEELAKMGPAIEPALKKALDLSTSAERSRRLRDLLEKIGKREGSPKVVAGRRAVEVLEQIGTPEARQALEKIAKSDSPSEIIEEAKLSLRRLAGTR